MAHAYALDPRLPARPTGPPEAPFPFSAFRRLRFGDRPDCPRCGSGRVQRWGSFSGRRRFRCVACRRTFSDFTGTALAYVKRLGAWSPYCACMRAALPIRASARYAGVSNATAFRWRHRILEALDRGDDAVLGRVVTIGETWFQHSRKGSRSLNRKPRRRRIIHRYRATPVWVLIARDQNSRVAGEVVGFRRPRPADVADTLAGRLAPGAELVSRFGHYGAPAVAADLLLRVPHRTVDLGAPEVVSVKWYIVRLHRWMRRFRGVATRYLANYLTWHRFVEAGGAWSERMGVAALSAGCPP